MKHIRVRDDVIPLTELKTHTSEVVRRLEESGRPVLLTRNGRGVAVLLSVDAYDDYQVATEQDALRRAIEAAERQVSAGQDVAHEVAEARMQRLLDRG